MLASARTKRVKLSSERSGTMSRTNVETGATRSNSETSAKVGGTAKLLQGSGVGLENLESLGGGQRKHPTDPPALKQLNS